MKVKTLEGERVALGSLRQVKILLITLYLLARPGVESLLELLGCLKKKRR